MICDSSYPFLVVCASDQQNKKATAWGAGLAGSNTLRISWRD
jgi:hypothetical protein